MKYTTVADFKYPTDSRGFRIMSDVKDGFKPIDGICQFVFKGHQVSISTAGMSIGACQTEIAIFRKDEDGKFTVVVHQTSTVEEAIEWILAV